MRSEFAQVVFSGGGTRCFWQGGFLEVLCDSIRMSPGRVSSVSGGALSAACFIAGREHALLENMQAIFRREDDHIAWDTAEDDGLTPHQRLFREAVETTLTEPALQRIASGPAFQILIAHPPLDTAPKASGTLTTLVYEAELHLLSTPHFSWPKSMGLHPNMVDARQAARDGVLIDLICAAVAIPPVFYLPLWKGRPVIDGGMADQAPLPDPDRGQTLILLTRQYRNLPKGEGRICVAPSSPVSADKIDFTDPDKIGETWEQGRRDAEHWLSEEHRG